MTTKAKRRGLCFDLGSKPTGLFGVAGDEIKAQVWDAFAPVWGPVVKFGVTSIFDEVTYAQMLDDLVRRNLRVYMDIDHATANLGWTVAEVPAAAFYCCVQVNHGGKLWRREHLAGHTCADAVELDAAANPEGLYAFRCHVTPVGREWIVTSSGTQWPNELTHRDEIASRYRLPSTSISSWPSDRSTMIGWLSANVDICVKPCHTTAASRSIQSFAVIVVDSGPQWTT